MATPHVSAIAALIWSSDPSKTNKEVRDAMNQSARDLGDAGRDNAYGYGLVQAYDAWNLLGGYGTSNVPPIASFTANCADTSCSFDAGASNDPDGSIDNFMILFKNEFGHERSLLVEGVSGGIKMQ